MEHGDLEANLYFEHLFNIKKEMFYAKSSEKHEIWIDHYNKIGAIDIPNLPYVLSLIHPDFYFKNGESFANEIGWKSSTFASGKSQIRICQAGEFTGRDCIFNQDPVIRGTCEADHIWPNSLGGPSTFDNRMWLCKFHNTMKSNEVSRFNWSAVPTWLESYIGKIYRYKI